ncbi:MAG: glycosyl hydrolase family 18 protein [Myxococcota bacterium]|nr:glycosyl hydrolase family 18 protein [Myxococcota bacterium]
MMFQAAYDLPSLLVARSASPLSRAGGRFALIVLCLLMLLAPSAAWTHGGLDDPATRSYACRFLDEDGEMCAQAWNANPQALYDWMEINIGDAGGVHEPRIPDGELCSAGRAKYGALDTPGNWPVTTLSPTADGVYDMSFVPHAPHATEYFRFYLTREGFDPETDSLNWSDLELVHDSGPISYTRMADEGDDFGFQMELPERPGRHILYLIWQRSDSLEAFYGCSDVEFSAFADENPDYPTLDGQPSPPSSPSDDESTPPASDPMGGSGHVDVTLTTASDWGAGFCADASVTNHTHSEIVWEATLAVPGEVVSFWDSRITAASADSGASSTVEVRGESWNQTLAAHASTTFGFCVDRTTSSSELATVIPSSDSHDMSSPHEEPTDPEVNDPPSDPTTDDSDSTTNEEVVINPEPPADPEEPTAPSDPGSSTPGTPAASQTGKPILAAYYPEWGIYGRNFFVADIPGDRLTHIIYAFVDLSAQGEITLFDPWAAVQKTFTGDQAVSGNATSPGNFGQLAELKVLYPHLRVSIAVGGWTLSTHFSTVLATPEGRETASESVANFLRDYPVFDGVDFDWEYPGGGGLGSNSADPADGTHYALFLGLVRAKLDQLGEERDRVYEISVASPAGSDKIANFNLPGVEAQIDFFNVMTYDFHGAWEDVTGHLAGFEGDATGYDIRTTIELYLAAGVPPEKIVLGAPLYTRAWGGVDAGDTGGYGQMSTAPAPGSFPDTAGMYDYKDLAEEWLAGLGGWELYWDDAAGAAYLYSPQSRIFSSFETPGTIAFRAEWAQHQGLRGMMFWDLSSDDPDHPESLIAAATRSWFGGLEFDEIVSQSDMQFEYILGGNGTFDPLVESPTEPSDITQPASPPTPEETCTPGASSADGNRRASALGRSRGRLRPHPRGWRPPECVPGAP